MVTAGELRNIADNVNKRIVEAMAGKSIDQVLLDCTEAAKVGKYSINLDQMKHPMFYDYSNCNYRMFINEMTDRLGQLGFKLLTVSDGSYGDEYYKVDFSEIE